MGFFNGLVNLSKDAVLLPVDAGDRYWDWLIGWGPLSEEHRLRETGVPPSPIEPGYGCGFGTVSYGQRYTGTPEVRKPNP